jgi:hypothetical protein
MFVPHTRYLTNWLTVIFFLLISITGCTSIGRVQKQEIKPIAPAALPLGNGWWHVRFRMNWPPDTEAVWYMDLYLAHQVIMPLLKQHKNDIVLWRFHRRAARDRASRQFSFIFYSSPQAAQQIFSSIKTNPHVNNLKFAGVIDQVVYDNPAKILRPNIEDTSDKKWPVSVQKTWPYYIAGVSRMWLDLISEVANDKLEGAPPSSLDEIEAFYQQVSEIMADIWQKDGRHAFMHHLNALFGYVPLIYYDKRYLTF